MNLNISKTQEQRCLRYRHFPLRNTSRIKRIDRKRVRLFPHGDTFYESSMNTHIFNNLTAESPPTNQPGYCQHIKPERCKELLPGKNPCRRASTSWHKRPSRRSDVIHPSIRPPVPRGGVWALAPMPMPGLPSAEEWNFLSFSPFKSNQRNCLERRASARRPGG